MEFIMKKINFFLIGMTSVLLAFAMIGCDNGTTTKTEYVNTGGGGGGQTGVPQEQYEAVRRKGELMTALNRDNVTVYVLSEITLDQDDEITLKDGQNIVVGGDSPDGAPFVQSAGNLGDGPLFQTAAPGVTPKLNIKTNLTLAKGSSLTIAKGAEVNVQTPTGNNEGTLLVKQGATVGVGVAVSGADLGSANSVSSLNVASNASLLFETDAVLAVSTSAATSKVKLADDTSKIDLVGVKLAVVQETPSAPAPAAATVFATSGNPIIEIPEGAQAAVDVEVYTAVNTAKTDAANSNSANVDSGLTSTVNGAAATATTSSPAKTTGDATGDNGVQALLSTEGVTEVTYTGTAALGAVSVPANKTLIIKGEVAAGDTDNSFTLANGAVLEIASGASVDFGADGVIAGTGTVTVTNNGTIKTAVTSVETLNDILKTKGKIEASAIAVSADATLTVPADTALTITAAVSGGTLKLALTGTIKGSITNDGGTIDLGTLSSIGELVITNTSGTIKTANGTMLAVLLDNVEDGTIEVTDDIDLTTDKTLQDTATLKVTTGKTLTVSGSLDVEDGATITAADDEDSGTITGDVTQVVTGIELSEETDVNPDGLNIDSVKRDLTTAKYGIVTITLKGNAGNVIPVSSAVYNDMFWDSPTAATETLIADKAALGYSAVVITGLVTTGTTGKIKQVNQAFNMWKPDTPGGHPATIQDYPNPGVFKEKVYTTDPNAYYPASIGGFDIMLWGGASRKTITLEITQPYSDDSEPSNDGPTKTYLIDYQNVTFTPEA
jgi:hypothetical protein